MVEEGGKALAAYLKPREEGRVDDQHDEITDMVKTLGQVAEYWLADPQRALELQTRLGKAYLDLWAARSSAWPAKRSPPVAEPDPRGQALRRPGMVDATSSSISSSRPTCSPRTGPNHLVTDAEGLDPHTRHKAEFYVAPDRQRAVAVELRADQSGTAARDAEHPTPKISSRGMHMLAEDIEAGGGDLQDPAVRRQDVRGRAQSRAHARQGDLPERV